jgi:hypothetical protein
LKHQTKAQLITENIALRKLFLDFVALHREAREKFHQNYGELFYEWLRMVENAQELAKDIALAEIRAEQRVKQNQFPEVLRES